MRAREIKFYQSGQAYDIFSNVTDVGFQMNIGGVNYQPKSSEAVYQGVKALSADNPNDRGKAQDFFADQRKPGKHLQEDGNKILNKSFRTGSTTFQGYQQNAYSFIGAPRGVELKEQVMYETLLAKFTQNPALLKALLETGDAQIIENTSLASYNDDFWGNGKSGNGKNALGIALMRVREDLGRELRANGSISIRTGFSNALANQLGIAPSVPIPKKNLTQQDLASVQATTTVAAFHASLQTQPRSPQVQQSQPQQPMAAQVASVTATSRVISAMQQHGFNASLSIVDDKDPKKKGEKVIKLKFANPQEAANFVKTIAKGYATVSGSAVVLGPNTRVFENLGVSSHGRTNPHKMFDALIFEERQRQARAKEANRYVAHSQQAPTLPARPAAQGTLDRLRSAIQDNGLTVSIDDNNRIQLHFSNANAANKFANNFGKVWRNPNDMNHFSIGNSQEAFVFNKLNIPTHGRTTQHAFGDALKFDFQQQNPKQHRLSF